MTGVMTYIAAFYRKLSSNQRTVFLIGEHMERLVLSIGTKEKDALLRLAALEYRDPRVQAVFIICEELERRGFLPARVDSQATPCPNETIKHQAEVRS